MEASLVRDVSLELTVSCRLIKTGQSRREWALCAPQHGCSFSQVLDADAGRVPERFCAACFAATLLCCETRRYCRTAPPEHGLEQGLSSAPETPFLSVIHSARARSRSSLQMDASSLRKNEQEPVAPWRRNFFIAAQLISERSINRDLA